MDKAYSCGSCLSRLVQIVFVQVPLRRNDPSLFVRSIDQLKVVFKDTDSLSYLIETLDLYKDMASFKHLLDLSDYPQDHFLHDSTNEKVPLTMTDDQQSKVLRGVVCLRSKSYSIDYVGGLKQSAKGVQKSV